jgi:uncharacterized HAD superfamily protein
MPRPITVVVDIDGVVATGTQSEVYSNKAGWAYEKCAPIPEGVEMVRQLKAKGFFVHFFTARLESDFAVTKAWLELHEIPYDKLTMGKPPAELYIDDKGYYFHLSHWGLQREIEETIQLNRAEKYSEDS